MMTHARAFAALTTALALAAVTVPSTHAARGQRLNLATGLSTYYDDNILQLSRKNLQRLEDNPESTRFRIRTADDVVAVVTADIGVISRRAVSDAVNVLADMGLLRRIQPAGSAARYEDRVGDNHHHLICRTCGRMVDVDCAVGATPCLTAADAAGYEIDEAEVIYWGRCPACRQAAEGT